MDKIIEASKSGEYTLEHLTNGKYAIKCQGYIMTRHGEYKSLEQARWRWGCYKYA